MTNDTTRAFDRFVHMFRLMIYAGIIFILLGVGISFAFVGAARSFVMSGSIGAGGLIIFGGIREIVVDLLDCYYDDTRHAALLFPSTGKR